MNKQFIGKRQVKETSVSGQKTIAGNEILIVTYTDDTVEHLSKMMFDKIVSEHKCDDTELREKRVKPVVEMVLSILREWGIKVGETQYLGVLLNTSLDYNTNQALLGLVKEFVPHALSLDDVDLIAVDRILRSFTKDVSE